MLARARVLALAAMACVLLGRPVLAASPPAGQGSAPTPTPTPAPAPAPAPTPAPTPGPADASNAAAAQALFDDAVKLMEAGRFGEACPKLAASEKLDPGAGTLLNLGTCYEKNGQTASAWATYQEAESTATRAGHADWAERAHAHVVALEPRLERLLIAVPKENVVTGLKVTRDGVVLDDAAWGAPIPLDPGKHEVRAVAPHKRSWSTTVDLKTEGSLSTVNVPKLEDALEAAPWPTVVGPVQPPPETEAGAPSFWTTQRVIGVVLAGVGVAGVAVGSGLGLAAKSKYDDAVAKYCPSHGTQCTSQGVAQGHDAHDLADISTGVFIGGGLALVAGGVVFALAPSVGADRVGIALGGRW
jgi:hypothetical protein